MRVINTSQVVIFLHQVAMCQNGPTNLAAVPCPLYRASILIRGVWREKCPGVAHPHIWPSPGSSLYAYPTSLVVIRLERAAG